MQLSRLLRNFFEVSVNVTRLTSDIKREVNLVTLTEKYLNFPSNHGDCIFMRVSTFGKSYLGCNISHMKYIYMGVCQRVLKRVDDVFVL